MLSFSKLQSEKDSIFQINTFLIILVIIFFLYNIPTKYFFYINISLTFVLSYLFFKKSRKLSKYLILTNTFIFFYFLCPIISQYLYELLHEESYIFTAFYNILLAYTFLVFSGQHKNFLRDTGKTNIKIVGLTIIIGLAFGLFFYIIREPIPQDLLIGDLNKIIFYTLILALSEQMIFSGFLSNIYGQLTYKKDSFLQVASIFVLFHLLRFENLVITYFQNFEFSYLYLITAYYFLLFVFMITALYLYHFHEKNMSGTFVYPVILHFVTDLTLILFTINLGYS